MALHAKRADKHQAASKKKKDTRLRFEQEHVRQSAMRIMGAARSHGKTRLVSRSMISCLEDMLTDIEQQARKADPNVSAREAAQRCYQSRSDVGCMELHSHTRRLLEALSDVATSAIDEAHAVDKGLFAASCKRRELTLVQAELFVVEAEAIIGEWHRKYYEKTQDAKEAEDKLRRSERANEIRQESIDALERKLEKERDQANRLARRVRELEAIQNLLG